MTVIFLGYKVTWLGYKADKFTLKWTSLTRLWVNKYGWHGCHTVPLSVLTLGRLKSVAQESIHAFVPFTVNFTIVVENKAWIGFVSIASSKSQTLSSDVCSVGLRTPLDTYESRTSISMLKQVTGRPGFVFILKSHVIGAWPSRKDTPSQTSRVRAIVSKRTRWTGSFQTDLFWTLVWTLGVNVAK